MTRSNAASASGVSRSPTCCERTTSLPRPRPTTFFRCAPTARTGGSFVATGIGSGAKPRARRRSWSSSPKSQPTLSSACRSTGRSWTRKRSARGPRRATASNSSVAIGSSERLPLVATSGASTAARRRWWSGVEGSITPRRVDSGATFGATWTVAARPRRGRRRIGASGERSQRSAAVETSQRARAAATSFTINASGFSRRTFPARRRATAASSASVAAEVEAAEPLHRDDPPVQERRRGGEERLVVAGERLAGAAPEREARPARRARGRLGVEAPVARLLVLAAAVGAEREAAHRRVRPVVRQRADDGEARAAVRAVQEGIAIPAIGRVVQLGEAVVARREVGKDRDALRATARALSDLEREETRRFEPGGRDAPHDGARRRLGLEARAERLEQERSFPPPRSPRPARR